MLLTDLKKRPDETEYSYIRRLGEAKDAGIINMTWQELADIFNKELRDPGVEYTESAYRKKYASMRQFKEEFVDDNISCDAKELIDLRRELEKEKIKVRDERNEYRKMIREEARKESYQEQFINAIEETVGKHPLQYKGSPVKVSASAPAMIVNLSDLHAGLNIKNFWNEYDGDVLKYRMQHYLTKIFEIKERHGAEDVYVIITEALSGVIWPVVRIQNNQDLIEQFMMVMDYLCDFISVLSQRFVNVNVYVAPGNHSRINPKKEQNLEHENMDNLIIPFLRARMQLHTNVKCFDNQYDYGIAVFSVKGINVVAVHGDKDSFESIADRMSKLLRIPIDLICCGHRHTNALQTSGDIKVVQSGCLSGSDEYAINHRLRNKPEQAVCVITDEDGLDCIYDVKF